MGALRDVIDAVAVAAERSGFATLWSGEHVVMVDESASLDRLSGGRFTPGIGIVWSREEFEAARHVATIHEACE